MNNGIIEYLNNRIGLGLCMGLSGESDVVREDTYPCLAKPWIDGARRIHRLRIRLRLSEFGSGYGFGSPHEI